MAAGWRRRHAHPWWRRAYDRFRRDHAGVVGKSQRVHFLQRGDLRLKRIVFGDAWQAASLAQRLEHPALVEAFPELVLHHEDTLILRFVEGRAFDPAQDLDRFADFYARLYACQPRQQPLAETPFHRRLLRDLRFLADSGILAAETAARLSDQAARLRPEYVWIGLDYTDPVVKNFVVAQAGLVAIDVESLESDCLLGSGLCKAQRHWMTAAQRRHCLDQLADHGAPDLAAQIAYVDLAQLAGWTKRKLLQGKPHFIRAERFAPWLED